MARYVVTDSNGANHRTKEIDPTDFQAAIVGGLPIDYENGNKVIVDDHIVVIEILA